MTVAPYTEKTFAEYLHQLNPGQAASLGWTVGASDPGSYQEIVNEALIGYDVDDIATITARADLGRLRAIGRVYYWQAVMGKQADKMSFGVDGARYDRRDLFNQAKAAYEAALREAASFGFVPGGVFTVPPITVRRIIRVDPYINEAPE